MRNQHISHLKKMCAVRFYYGVGVGAIAAASGDSSLGEAHFYHRQHHRFVVFRMSTKNERFGCLVDHSIVSQ